MHIGTLKKAIEEAESSCYIPHRIGAVIFKGSRILSSGHNELRGNGKIHPKYKHFDNSIHAEQAAVLDLKDWSKAKNANILIVRINNLGQMRLAYPCDMCQQMIKYLGINKIFYSDSEGKIQMIKTSDLENNYE